MPDAWSMMRSRFSILCDPVYRSQMFWLRWNSLGINETRIRCLSTRRGPLLSSSSQSLDLICELAASNLRFGPGSTAEVGQDLSEHFLCQKQVVVVTDPHIRTLPCMTTLLESLERSKVDYIVFDDVRVEPNADSFQRAISFLENEVGGMHHYDAMVAIGGGSVLDTAKVANLYACLPPPDKNFYAYVNPPIGLGMPIPNAVGRVKPIVAIPTTAGTGSETTGVAIFDDSATRSKTGIANRQLKPSLGIIDPDNTATLPRAVATYSGLDVLCHAMESYTALPFNQRPRPSSPTMRPTYQGSNPISDVWSLFALQTCVEFLPRVVKDSSDVEARSRMLLASSAAGLGFGNAGVHLCHGMSYPISSQVPDSYQCNYEHVTDHALVPHGLSVIVSAPVVFAWTASSDPERHATCARILAEARTGISGIAPNHTHFEYVGDWLAEEIRWFCDRVGIPSLTLRQFGYTEANVESLVEGTLPQHRVTKVSPRPVTREALTALFMAAINQD